MQLRRLDLPQPPGSEVEQQKKKRPVSKHGVVINQHRFTSGFGTGRRGVLFREGCGSRAGGSKSKPTCDPAPIDRKLNC